MAYCTGAQMLLKFGAKDMAHVTDYDGDGAYDVATVDAAIDSVSAKMDSYFAVLYAVPIVPTTDDIRDCCIQLTWCYLLRGRDSMTDTHKDACTEWMAWLKDCATGKAIPSGAAPTASASAPYVRWQSNDRIFGRDQHL